MLVVGADRVPGGADAGRAAERAAALAADPAPRVRALARLGFQDDAVEARVAAAKAWRAFGPQHAEGVDILVGHRAALGERRADDGVELRLQPAGADADDQPPAGQHVERGQ